jgi:hypothetical protein
MVVGTVWSGTKNENKRFEYKSTMLRAALIDFNFPTFISFENTMWSKCQHTPGSEGLFIRPAGMFFLFVGRWNLQALQPKAIIFAKLRMDPSVGL